MSSSKSKTFEESFSRLEKVVHALEEGQESLDESLALYEEGVGLLKTCHQQLESAKRKVEILSGVNEMGEPRVEDWEEDARSLEEKAETKGR